MNKFILPTLIITLIATPMSWAKRHHDEETGWARVLKVQPVRQRVEYRVPQESCWNEPVRREPRRNNTVARNNDAFAGTIVGGIIGGVVGNKVGRHNGNKSFGTVLGAVVGATVGNGLSNHSSSNHRPSSQEYAPQRYQRHCDVVTTVRHKEKIVAYDVWYRYQGNKYQARMDKHPGRKIKVRVDVQPY